jgi:hypothetical protein
VRSVYFFLAFSISFNAFNQTITGRVLDAHSKETLPFVNIFIQGTTQGTSTNIDGRFALNVSDGDSLILSYVGYEGRVVAATYGRDILLRESIQTLTQVEVFATENPALDIIRKVIENRDGNDPKHLTSFSYDAYHKLYATAEGSFDTVQRKTKAIDFLENQYIFLSETYSRRKFVKPHVDKEVVLANKMSGVNDPSFAVLGTNFQPFSFYGDHIALLNKNYINPISTRTFQRYEFDLEDIICRENDTTYIISFQPIEGRLFEGMKGLLFINSHRYAIESVVAEPHDPASLVKIKIEQKYSRLHDHWFPVELNTEILFKEQKIADHPLKYIHRSYLSHVEINSPSPYVAHDGLNVSFDPDANKRSQKYWTNLRGDSLGIREKNTYAFYDSMPTQTLATINALSKTFEALAIGKIKAEPFYLPFQTLIRKNLYEGIRLGLGLETTESLSKTITANAFIAYGVRDKALKYGFGLQINLRDNKQSFFKTSFRQDVAEAGNSNFLQPPPSLASGQSVRNWLACKMDSVIALKAEFNFRPMRFVQTAFFIQHSKHNPTYAYQFESSHDATLQDFTLAEVGLQFKFVAGETFAQIGNVRLVNGFKYPQLNVAISRFVKNVSNGDFSFTKIEGQLDYQFMIHGIGRTSVRLAAGYLGGEAPYFSMFNGRGINTGKFDLNSFVSPNFFQTMGIYEFASDRYSYLFLNQNFGRIVRTRSQYFRPELTLMQNMGIGAVKNLERHQDIEFRTMLSGFFESGAIVTNLLRVKYFNLAYVGLGGGVFNHS